MKKAQLKTPPDLARLITDIDEENSDKSPQLSFTHATVISWAIIKGYKNKSSKKEIIENVMEKLPVLKIYTLDGNVRKSKFTWGQLNRVSDALDDILKYYYWPWSRVRKGLKAICKKN